MLSMPPRQSRRAPSYQRSLVLRRGILSSACLLLSLDRRRHQIDAKAGRRLHREARRPRGGGRFGTGPPNDHDTAHRSSSRHPKTTSSRTVPPAANDRNPRWELAETGRHFLPASTAITSWSKLASTTWQGAAPSRRPDRSPLPLVARRGAVNHARGAAARGPIRTTGRPEGPGSNRPRHAGLSQFAGPFLSRMKFVDDQGKGDSRPTLSALRAYGRTPRCGDAVACRPMRRSTSPRGHLQPLIRHDGVTDRRRWESALQPAGRGTARTPTLRSRCARSRRRSPCPPSDRRASSSSASRAPRSAARARGSPRSTGTP